MVQLVGRCAKVLDDDLTTVLLKSIQEILEFKSVDTTLQKFPDLEFQKAFASLQEKERKPKVQLDRVKGDNKGIYTY